MKMGPCKDCTDRAVGCHAKCSRYLEWRELARSERLALDKEIRMRNTICEVLGRPVESSRGSRR